ncbi:hypothetical protein [Lapidilactobacillus luobeiensis]|uniref:hypothetical protein n=1 Tax=Lapidilactobacillus luobeiensis TaxID=2950371 RepID=UPI0021C39E4A|nr:hypothetical protein [Lapidilactobacillus luobeiensis]
MLLYLKIVAQRYFDNDFLNDLRGSGSGVGTIIFKNEGGKMNSVEESGFFAEQEKKPFSAILTKIGYLAYLN